MDATEGFRQTVLLALGRLEGTTLGNRQAMLEQTAATNLRIDDLRREHYAMHRDLSGRLIKLETPSKDGPLSWIKHIPWDRVLLLLVSLLGTLGWVKPSWLKALTGGP